MLRMRMWGTSVVEGVTICHGIYEWWPAALLHCRTWLSFTQLEQALLMTESSVAVLSRPTEAVLQSFATRCAESVDDNMEWVLLTSTHAGPITGVHAIKDFTNGYVPHLQILQNLKWFGLYLSRILRISPIIRKTIEVTTSHQCWACKSFTVIYTWVYI